MNDQHQLEEDILTKIRVALGMKLIVCMAFALAIASSGCKSSESTSALAQATALSATNEPVRLHPGDVVQVTFPGAPNMNTTERVRVDGSIFMPLVDEVPAAGKTPKELQDALVKAYSPHLQVKEVVVIVSSSAASIFVTGAVNHPGRISMERPMTVLDAIMESGGFNPKSANVRKVKIIRQNNGQYRTKVVDLKPVLKGENVVPVWLEPFDMIYVPEKIF